MTDAIETYLEEVHAIRSSGAAVKETSGYGALGNLFNAAGHALKPKVRCFIQVKNSGAGLPDGGLFTADQIKNTDEAAPLLGIPQPARGVIEVKATDAEVDDVADTQQVRDYVKHYGQVLVTNYRSFLLLQRGDHGSPVRLESFQLAPDEKSFWLVAAQPRKAAAELGERFAEYLKRVLLHAAPLNNPKDVAFFLASYARDARARVENAGDLPALNAVRSALEEALGMKFEAEKGEHFFRSTLVQTLFYGVFSAWVLWHKQQAGRGAFHRVPNQKKVTDAVERVPTEQFDWKMAAWTLHVPMIKALFEQVATPTKLGPLGLVEVLDWTAAALNRVDRAAFFERFVEDHAVQYFYEPFLEAFDPELRKQLGVWYTPPEIVRYQVARVDAALREELDIPDGLADPRVFVLDPCCGTGAYLVEVLRHIHKFLKEDQGMGALAEHYTKQAAQERVFGFELLPAPFVVAHLQMGLLLQNLGVPLDDVKERAAIYLTNALTGWEPPSEAAKKQLTFAIPEFKQEKEAADGIKQEKKIIVILGNPPYNGYAGLAVEEERDLSNAYRTTKRAAAPQGQGLNDLYVRFFRMAERRIVEKSGEGIISFISNYSWLDGLSFTGMREKFLEVFDSITVDCLNGDKFKTGKVTPEGEPDPSVFSTESNREGIQVGTAIATLVKRGARPPRAQPPTPSSSASGGAADVTGRATTSGFGARARRTTAGAAVLPTEIHFRHLWGKDKRSELLATLKEPKKKIYTRLKPPLEVGLPFLPMKTEAGFYKWPLLTELFPAFFSGVQTKQDALLIDIDRSSLEKRMELYFNGDLSDEDVKRLVPGSMDGTDACEPKSTRAYLIERGFLAKYIVRHTFRPFDVRWLYWEPETKLVGRKVPEYFQQIFEGNIYFVTQQKPRREWSQPQVIRSIGCLDLMDRGASCVPLLLKPNPEPLSLFDRAQDEKPKANLTAAAKEFLADLRLGNQPEELFYHTLAVLHSPEYRMENSGALRQDWPRVPLPTSREALLASAELGRQVAALLDTETPVDGVTKNPCPELKAIAEFNCAGKSNLKVTAGWGHAGQNGVTMPGKGRLETRGYTAEEAAAFAAGRDAFHRVPNQTEPEKFGTPWKSSLPELLGPATHDIFLNEAACWRNVPERVWAYTIGGYQVMKKWLSYREFELLGRALTPDEAREVTHTARRLAALILLQPELDASYQRVKAKTFAWKP